MVEAVEFSSLLVGDVFGVVLFLFSVVVSCDFWFGERQVGLKGELRGVMLCLWLGGVAKLSSVVFGVVRVSVAGLKASG